MNAVEILDRINTERKEKRAELWKEIQTRDPNLAKLLEVVKARFGRPEKVDVRFYD